MATSEDEFAVLVEDEAGVAVLVGVVLDLVLLAVDPEVSASGTTVVVLPEADGEVGAFALEVADVVNNGVVGQTTLIDVAVEGLMRLSVARKRPAVLDFGFSGRSEDSCCGGYGEAGCDHPGRVGEEVDGLVLSLTVDDCNEIGHRFVGWWRSFPPMHQPSPFSMGYPTLLWVIEASASTSAR